MTIYNYYIPKSQNCIWTQKFDSPRFTARKRKSARANTSIMGRLLSLSLTLLLLYLLVSKHIHYPRRIQFFITLSAKPSYFITLSAKLWFYPYYGWNHSLADKVMKLDWKGYQRACGARRKSFCYNFRERYSNLSIYISWNGIKYYHLFVERVFLAYVMTKYLVNIYLSNK